MAERDVVQVVALRDFRTTGMPDSSYTHFDAPLVTEGQTLYVTEAQRAYLKTMVKEVGDPDPTHADYIATADAVGQPYNRQPSPYPHLYYPGKSTSVMPDANHIEARLDATTTEVTLSQSGSPFGTGHADHPELYEEQPTVKEADAEETQRTRRVLEVVDPANT